MGYDVILDAVVDRAGDDAAIEQLVLGAIGPEADNARRPGVRHSRHLQELVDRCRIDINPVLGGGDGFRLRRRHLRLESESSVRG